MNRRRVLTIFLCLLAGAIINVLVAWGCATVLGEMRGDALLVELEAILARTNPSTGIEHENLPEGGFISRRVWQPAEIPAARRFESTWYTVDSVSSPSALTTTLWVGWPAHSLRAEFDDRRPHTLRASTLAFAFTKPLWPGFLINTLFYGAIAWTLFFTPRAVRRHRRAKRRQCPTCGYPVGVNPVCTECGEGV